MKKISKHKHHPTSSSPPDYLPHIGLPISNSNSDLHSSECNIQHHEEEEEVVGGGGRHFNIVGRTDSPSSCSSSTAALSSTPPSSLSHRQQYHNQQLHQNQQQHNQHHVVSMNMNMHMHMNTNIKQSNLLSDDVSNSSSLSVSPSTPRKEWETRFKSYQIQRNNERLLDDSSADDSSSNTHHKYDGNDISVLPSPSSLPKNYILANKNPSLIISSNNQKKTKSHSHAGGAGLGAAAGGLGTTMIGSKIVVPPAASLQALVQQQKQQQQLQLLLQQQQREQKIHLTKSLDDSSGKRRGRGDRGGSGGGGWLSNDDDNDDDDNDDDDNEGNVQTATITNNNKNTNDSSIRGGNLFAMFGKKKKQNNENKGNKKNRFIKAMHLASSDPNKRRAKSYDSLLDTSMRHGDGGGSRKSSIGPDTNTTTTTTGRGGGHGRSLSDGKSQIRARLHTSSSSSSKYGPVGTVIGPDGVLRSHHMKTKIDPKKEKKLVFTELRNDAKIKDSATAFLGEEKSTHRGRNFAAHGLQDADKHLTPVEEETSDTTEGLSILNPIEGVESWTEESKNLIFPAFIAMCRPMVFEKIHSVVSNSEDDSSKIRFGCISFGFAQVAKLVTNAPTRDGDYNWRRGHFELRQNFLLEYDKDGDVTRKPRGYAFLQGAVVKRHLHFGNTLHLEFKKHQSKKIRCTVLIRLKSTIEEERWLWCLSQAAKLRIEDLFQYDSSEMGKELGKGRYASIRPARRHGKSKPKSSYQQSFSGGNEDGIGILKKKPSFSSFSNLSILTQEDYECALKIVDKKLFWKNVKKGNERADSLVRETCVQAALIAQASEHHEFLRLKSFFETEEKVVLELELLEGTDLYQYIKKKQPLSEFEASKIMGDILKCVVVMNDLGIAHRDLKPANILMANKSNRYGTSVNVGDFGNATFVGDDNLVRGRCGTVGYVAPEIFLAGKNSGYQNKVDEFSAGVILYVLLCGYEPFYGETEKQLIEENKRAVVEFPEEDWQSISIEGRDLVEKLLTKDPAKRISARKALEHPWLTRRALRIRQANPHEEQNDQSDDVDEFACNIS